MFCFGLLVSITIPPYSSIHGRRNAVSMLA